MSLERLLVACCVIAAVGQWAVFITIALLRMRYPFELEWLEGGMLEEVRQLLDGKPLYQKPSIEYAPFIYTPVYHYVAAAFCRLFGVGFPAARLVSFLSTLGSAGLIFAWVRRSGWLPAVLAVGLFAACYEASGYYYDTARVDAVALVLALSGIYLLTRFTGLASAALAALFLTAAYQTKQTQAVILIAAVPAVFLYGWRRGVTFALTLIGAMVSSFVWLNASSNGWYRFYTVTFGKHFPLAKEMLWQFWTLDMATVFPVALALIILAALYARRSTNLATWAAPLLLAGSLLACSWGGRIHGGAWRNHLMPVHAALCVAFGLAFAELRQTTWFGRSAARRSLLLGLCLAQLVWIRADPNEQIPTQADRAAGEAVVAKIASIPGEVWIPDHAYLARMAGKTPFVHRSVMQDLLRTDEEVSEPFGHDVQQALHQRRFSALIMDYPEINPTRKLAAAAAPGYIRTESIPYDGENTFRTVVGWHLRPEFVFRPR